MSDNFRYRYGDTDPIVATIATAQAAALGDLLGYEANTIVRAEDEVWQTTIAAPAAPTVAASAATRGTALTNALTGVKVSLNFPWGEGTLSAAGTATPTAAFGLKVTLAALPAPAVSWNVYVEDSAGSGTYKLQQVVPVGAVIVYVDSYGAGQVPPTAAPQDATTITQYNFCKNFMGHAMQRKLANVATVGTGGGPANFLRVARAGVFDLACASATFNVDDLVGPAKAAGNTLLSQTVIAVTHRSLATHRVVDGGASLTTVRCRLLGKIKGGLAA